MFLAFLTFAAMASSSYVKFHIIDIEVSHLRYLSERYVLSEARLKKGGTYTEHELELARRTLLKTPYANDVEFSLKKGTNRGTYILNIEIEETPILFFSFERTERIIQMNDSLPPSVPEEGAYLNRSGSIEQFAPGIRWFLHPLHMAYVSGELEGNGVRPELMDGEPFRVGYSAFDLFSSGLSLNVDIKMRSVVEGNSDPNWPTRTLWENRRPITFNLNLSYPIKRRQWLQSRYIGYRETEEIRFEEDRYVLFDERRTQREEWGVYWIFDSTDDLVIPTRGTRLKAGTTVVRYENHYAIRLESQFGYTYANDWSAFPQGHWLDMEAGYTHRIQRNFSIGAAIEGSLPVSGRDGSLTDTHHVALTATALNHFSIGKSRLLTLLTANLTEWDHQFSRDRVLSVELSVSLRLASGLVRFGVQYGKDERSYHGATP